MEVCRTKKMKIKLEAITKRHANHLLRIAFNKGKNDIPDYEFEAWLNEMNTIKRYYNKITGFEYPARPKDKKIKLIVVREKVK